MACQRMQFKTLSLWPYPQYAQEQKGAQKHKHELPDSYIEEVVIFFNEET